MPRPKSNPLSGLTVADLMALLAEKEIEDLRARQAEREADLRRIEKELARLVKGAGVGKPAPKRPADRAAAKPGAKKARKKAGARNAPANGAPMAVPVILATFKKPKLVKTGAAEFAGVVR